VILGVEHIALSCADIETGVAGLAARGFAPAFVERDIPNAPEKRSLLHTYTARHDIASCRAQAGIAIELTNHGPVYAPAPPSYEVTFGGGGIVAVAVISGDVRASKRFWRDGLRFTVAAGNADDAEQALLAIRPPVAAWAFELRVAPGPQRALPMLDDEGFPCVALITNRLDADLAQALSAGGHSPAGPFVAHVNGNELHVALLRGPGGELVELIAFARKGGAA